MRISNEQLELFHRAARSKIPGKFLGRLQQQGIPVAYDPEARTLSVSDQPGRVTILAFDGDGLPSTLTRPSGLQYRFAHDAQGRLARILYPSSRELRVHREPGGTVATFHQPDIGTYSFSRDAGGYTITYPDGHRSVASTDTAGRVVAVTNRLGATTQYVRNVSGELEAVNDPLGRTTRFVRDDFGNLSEIHFPDGRVQYYAFSPEERTAVTVAPDGSTTELRLDAQGGILEVLWADGSQTSFTRVNGIPVEIRNLSTTLKITYDDAGRPLSESSDLGEVTYQYDAAKRVTALALSGVETVAFTYDLDGRLQTIRDWDGGVTRCEHNEEDLLSRLMFPNGVTLERSFDVGCRTHASTLRSPGGETLIAQSYAYDACGRMTSYAERAGDTPPSTCRFEYDVEDRLIAEQCGPEKRNYNYDACANMVRRAGMPVTFGVCNEPVAMGGSVIDYDGRGNIVGFTDRAGNVSCRYGADGLLSECRTASGTVSFAYDGLGRRISKTTQDGIWRYGWAGQTLLWEEYWPNSYNDDNKGTPLRRDYLFLPGSFQPLGFRENGQIYWLATDERNAVVAAVDSSGRIVWRATYDAFGEAHITTEAVRQPWRLEGHYCDDETNLYYSLNRYYSPYLCSYLARDPQWLEYGNSNYSYACNDPWNRSDPAGGFPPLLAAVGIAALAGAVIGGVIGGISASRQGRSVLGGIAGGTLEGGIAGAGVVLAGAAAVAASAGALVTGAIAIGGAGLAAGIGAFGGSMAEQAINGDKVSVECGVESAAWAFGITVALGGLGAIPGVRRAGLALARTLTETGVGRWAQRALRNVALRSVPSGLTRGQFASLSKRVLAETEKLGLGKDVVVHGSRASGLSLAGSDIDIAVRMSEEDFDGAIKQSFKKPNPGSAKEATMLHAQQAGKITARPAKLSGLASEVYKDTGKKVQISIIRKNGPFDTGPVIPLKGE